MNLAPPESDPNLSRRERKAAESRDKIFRAAIELFSREGLDGVTIEQITDRADVGKGLFFPYFPNKEAVLNHFGTLQVLRLREALATGEISGPPRRRAEQVLSLLCTYPEITPELARNLFLSALATREFRQIGGPNIWEVRDLLAEIIREGQATGECCPTAADPHAAALFLLGQYFLGLLAWCSGFSSDSLEKTVLDFAQCAFNGIDVEGAPCRTCESVSDDGSH